ncbi:spore germination protein [Bacillus sp. 7884-1]|uniref:spore germination protein n=1 Tax=Bacillus sp. 7884-1 TaxID=2021693 RepID=UPI000BA69990|nr:spore germination protein [Bacillus sp. 7884-1]PAE39102.1 hypothetical protein CHI06_17405 [Bacillus sp. 7884-1]
MGRFRTILKKIFLQKDTDFVNLLKTQHLNSNKKASNEKTITEATYDKTLTELGDSFDLVHRSFNQDEIQIIYLDSLVDSKTLEWEILSPLIEMSFNHLEKAFQQSLFKRENNQEKVINGILNGNTPLNC